MFTTIDMVIAGTFCFVFGIWFGMFLATAFTIAEKE